MVKKRAQVTFLVLRQTEMDIPAGNQDHIISQVLPLNLGFLHDDDISLEDIKHILELWLAKNRGTRGMEYRSYLEAASLRPWLVRERVPIIR